MFTNLRNSIVHKVASRHVAGKEIKDAIQVCNWLKENSFNIILAPWADPSVSASNGVPMKEMVMNEYKSAIKTLHSKNIEAFLSIKLDVLDYDYGILKELIEYAKGYKTTLHIDSLGPDSAVKTFQLLEQASSLGVPLGCTLPSRWNRSLDDADLAIELGLSVRIVKGQWEDPGSKIDHKQNFLSIAEKLAGNVPRIGVATHDLSLADQALSVLSAGGNSTIVEFEQFFSLPLNGIKLIKNKKYPYRVYVSYGAPSIPYNYKFALTRPSLAIWMLFDLIYSPSKPWS